MTARDDIKPEWLDAFAEGWHSVPEGEPGDRRRAGLAAVLPLIYNDLRATVEILPDAHRRKSKMGGKGYGQWGGDGSIWRGDVLSLLGGEPVCDHCKGNPPVGHECPRCGRSND
jgi:hypothetical protein